MNLPDRLFVTGTDTDVGKTVVCALLCHALGYDYFKPVQAGRPHDSDTVRILAGCPVHPERHRLKRPASPHASAMDEGLTLSLADFTLPNAPRLVVEGAGGVAVPLCAEPPLWQVDLIRHFGLPTLVVARTGLGTLNHTFTALHYLKTHQIPVVGLVLVGDPHPENERDLDRWGAPVLARVPQVNNVPHSFMALSTDFSKQVST